MEKVLTGEAPRYLAPDVPGGLKQIDVPVIDATPENLKGYGALVDNHQTWPVEITRWPAQGWRPVDVDSGDEGGTVEGIFEFWWRGEVLYGRNNAVNSTYILGWSKDPAEASDDAPEACNSQVLLWHCNYHPDGGQLFYPLDGTPYVVPLALPGDDVKPEDFIAFRFDGSQGLYIHPGVWHEGVFPVRPGRFFDKQGAVHARISVDFAREFKCLLRIAL